jgi:hypothetical protein
MKRAYSAVRETIARFVRWVIAGIVSVIVALPTIASFGTSV